MAHVQALAADSDAVLLSSVEGNVCADHDTRSSLSTAGKRSLGTHLENLPFRHSTSENVVENPTGTGTIEGQERLTLSWLHGLKNRKWHTPDPKDDDDAEYRAEVEENIEVGALDTSCTKSTRTGKKSKRAKLTREVV
jgi:hypothetical protein